MAVSFNLCCQDPCSQHRSVKISVPSSPAFQFIFSLPAVAQSNTWAVFEFCSDSLTHQTSPAFSKCGSAGTLRKCSITLLQLFILVPCPLGFPSLFFRLPELHLAKQIYNMVWMHIYSINYYHKHFRKERPKHIQVLWIQSWAGCFSESRKYS